MAAWSCGRGLGKALVQSGKDREWELFDCEKNPLELFSVYSDPDCRDIVTLLTTVLNRKMNEIGDTPEH